MEKPVVSVVVLTHNLAGYLEKCLVSVLNQSFTGFELIIVDDFSNDTTDSLVKKFNDERIIYLKNTFKSTIPRLRNQALDICRGDYIFFTDADCYVNRYWLEEGLRVFDKEGKGAIGVQGRTFYDTAATDLRDIIVEIREGEEQRTCNIAYRKEVFLKVGKFNERYAFCKEDLDLAFGALKIGRIAFSDDMVVTHQRRLYDKDKILDHIKRAKNEIEFLIDLLEALKTDSKKRHLCEEQRVFASHYTGIYYKNRIFKCREYAYIFFPFLLLQLRPRNIKMIFILWPKFIITRLIYWRAAFSHKKLIL